MIKLSATLPLQHDTIYSPFGAADFEDGLKWLNDNGFEGVELCVTNPSTINAKQIKEKLAGLGLLVSTISTGQAVGLEGLSLTAPDPVVRQRTVNRLKDQVAFAAQIECPQVTIGLIRGIGSSEAVTADLEVLKDGIYACALFGQKYGIKLILEPLNKAESNLLNNVPATMDFLNSLHNPANVGVLLDTYHSAIEDDRIEAAIKKLGNRLFHVHFSDSNRGLPGSGSIDYSSVAAALVKNRFDGFVSLEVKNIPHKDAVIRDGHRSMAQYIKQ